MKTKTTKTVALLLFIVLSAMSLISISLITVSAYNETVDTRLLVILGDETDISTLPLQENVIYKKYSDMSTYNNQHIAYAVSNSIASDSTVNQMIRDAYERDALIYIYGNLTIAEFKNIMGIDDFGISTNVYDENGITERKAFMHFDEEQELNKLEQIISFSRSEYKQKLIVTAPHANETDLIAIISDHFCSRKSRTTLIYNSFDHRTYPLIGNAGSAPLTTCYLSMDYYLYTVENETIEDYDYYALRVNVNPVYDNPSSWGKLSCTELGVRLVLPKANDHFYEYGPSSSNSANNINVNLSFGSTGISGGIGFTFSPGTSPDLSSSYNSANRTVSWEVTRRLFGSDLNDAMYPFGATWASYGNDVSVDISNYVVFDAFDSDWNTVQVRYSL